MIVTALLSAGVALAYVGLGTVRFKVAAAAVLRYGHMLGIPNGLPLWMPGWMKDRWDPIFRFSARVFFLGCAYTHFEIAAHALTGDLPDDYFSFSHQSIMFLQGVGAWYFVGVLTMVQRALGREGHE